MSPRDVVSGVFAALDARDLDGVSARLAGSVTADIPPLGIRNGERNDTVAFFAELLKAFPDLRMTVKRLVVTGDAVTAEVKVEGTQAAGYAGAINQEKHLDVDEAWHLEVSDGLVTAFEAFWCQQQLLRRLGVKRFDRVALV